MQKPLKSFDMYYKNVEIGTADFDTLIEEAEGNGISIEPIPKYFDNLPDRDGWEKLNVAITDYNGTIDAYYVDRIPEGVPQWARGCNSVGSPHLTILKRWPYLLKKTTVKCITLKTLFDKFDIDRVGFLKVDTEGMDYNIISQYLDGAFPLPDRIQFEWNSLSDDKKMFSLCNRLRKFYVVNKKQFNVICELQQT